MPRARPILSALLRLFTATMGLVLLVVPAKLIVAEDASREYVPVAPATAIHFVTLAQLNLVRDWLDQKDYPSAQDSAVGLTALVDLLGYQGSESGWREKIQALHTASNQLVAAAKRKDRADCSRLTRVCDRLLAELAKEKTGPKSKQPDFRPPAATRTWMLLLDGTYADAKTSKSVKEMEQHAYAIAEEANLVAHLRKDERWRATAQEVRDLAMAAGEQARAGKLEQARSKLKSANQRCEACHQGFKR